MLGDGQITYLYGSSTTESEAMGDIDGTDYLFFTPLQKLKTNHQHMKLGLMAVLAIWIFLLDITLIQEI